MPIIPHQETASFAMLPLAQMKHHSINVILMYVITSPRGSARCGKEWSCRVESHDDDDHDDDDHNWKDAEDAG